MELDLYLSANLKLLKVGGAITGSSSLINKKLPELLLKTPIDKNIVIISLYLKQNLTDSEFRSIYYHEIGHIAKGHNSRNSRILTWQEKELEADAYSSSRVGASTLLSALKKIPDIIRECLHLKNSSIGRRTDIQYYTELDSFLNRIDNQMQFRYNALKKRC